LNKRDLQPGDILLFKVAKHSPWHDKLIALGEKLLHKNFTKSNYCHAAMIDADTDLMLEAVWPVTHIIKIKSRNNKIEVFRIRNATPEQKLKAVKWTHKNLGLWYNVGQLLFGLFPRKHEVICSTYVAKAWKSSGIILGDINEKVFSPDEIAADPQLQHLGELRVKN
jgi:uncharacterized protein YycO